MQLPGATSRLPRRSNNPRSFNMPATNFSEPQSAHATPRRALRADCLWTAQDQLSSRRLHAYEKEPEKGQAATPDFNGAPRGYSLSLPLSAAVIAAETPRPAKFYVAAPTGSKLLPPFASPPASPRRKLLPPREAPPASPPSCGDLTPCEQPLAATDSSPGPDSECAGQDARAAVAEAIQAFAAWVAVSDPAALSSPTAGELRGETRAMLDRVSRVVAVASKADPENVAEALWQRLAAGIGRKAESMSSRDSIPSQASDADTSASTASFATASRSRGVRRPSTMGHIDLASSRKFSAALPGTEANAFGA